MQKTFHVASGFGHIYLCVVIFLRSFKQFVLVLADGQVFILVAFQIEECQCNGPVQAGQREPLDFLCLRNPDSESSSAAPIGKVPAGVRAFPGEHSEVGRRS